MQHNHCQRESRGLRIETGPGCIGAVDLFIMRFLIKNGRSTPVQNRHLTGRGTVHLVDMLKDTDTDFDTTLSESFTLKGKGHRQLPPSAIDHQQHLQFNPLFFLTSHHCILHHLATFSGSIEWSEGDLRSLR